MNALEMSGVGKRYKGFALENVNLALPEGCILGLIGENGAGKTTLIKLLLGMAQGKGEIRVLGRDIRREGAAIRQETGVVLDEACFPEGLDALQVNRCCGIPIRIGGRMNSSVSSNGFPCPNASRLRNFRAA